MESAVIPNALCTVLAACLVAAPTGGAYAPPAVFVASPAGSPAESPVWEPAGASIRPDLGRYLFGLRLQVSGRPENRQSVWRRLVSTPNGAPVTPDNQDLAEPACLLESGPAGTIAELFELEYEGSGRYVLEIGLREEEPASNRVDCTPAGPTTTVVLDVDPRTSLSVVGDPVAHPGRSDRDGRHGLQVSYPAPHGLGAGGPRELECALDAIVRPDGSISGRHLRRAARSSTGFHDESIFDLAGEWTCVARAGYTASGVVGARYAPWSPPVLVRVPGAFRLGQARLADARGPVFAIVATVVSADRFGDADSAAAAGAVVFATIGQDPASLGPGDARIRAVRRARGVVDRRGQVRLRFRLPGPRRVPATFVVRTTIGAAPLVVAGPGRDAARRPLRVIRRTRSEPGSVEVVVSDPAGR